MATVCILNESAHTRKPLTQLVRLRSVRQVPARFCPMSEHMTEWRAGHPGFQAMHWEEEDPTEASLLCIAQCSPYVGHRMRNLRSVQ